MSDASRAIHAQITTAPVYGSVSEQEAGFPTAGTPTALLPGQLTSLSLNISTYTTGLRLQYQAPTGVFTSPKVTWTGLPVVFPNSTDTANVSGSGSIMGEEESLAYKFVTDGITTAEASSLETTQDITIININEPTQLSFSYEQVWEDDRKISVYPIGYVSDTDSSNSISSVATISGFDLFDPDMGVDPVQVRVTTNGGDLYLNEDAIDFLDFTGFEMCFGKNFNVGGV